jgi:fructose-specific phosphotransferase system IIC component
MAGYIVDAIKRIKLPAALRSLNAVLVVPLFGTAIIGLLMFYVVGPPVTWLNNALTMFLGNLGTTSSILLLFLAQ